jgi:hypothetical protein
VTSPETHIDRSCGPSGCEVNWLTSARHDLGDLNDDGFSAWALDMGWGDGLPMIAPTEGRVRAHLAAGGRFPDELVAKLPPLNGDCTAEKAAINAVMAGAPPAAMPLIFAALEAMADPAFNLAALNATTGSVVPAVLVNGPQRDRLPIPYGVSCFGGVAGPAPAIGRALRLIMRNVAGQLAGTTSQSVFGQPGRIAGIVVGEWEERSPWAPLAERLGVAGDAVTVFPAMGTTNICDVTADTGARLLQLIGQGMVHAGANGMITPSAYAGAFVAINPTWADIIAAEIPRIEDVQQILWERASLPLDAFPDGYQGPMAQMSRHHAGLVHLAQSPADVLVMVAGGLGNLHAMTMHSWGDSRSVTRAVAAPEPA